MDLIQGLIQQPKVQSADETIPTLCDRVENSTLINDRRSAVLGLKAFSRQYRESVIASGLKPLLNTLKRDYMDEDSVKAILETILILFIRGDGHDDLTRGWISQQSRLQNGKYPSPLVMKQEKEQVDQFSLWIADALTQSEDLIHLLVEFWEIDNFHIRLYTIQLLEAMMATRPLKARSALISLPTSISTMVSLLDDMHEPIRDEAILLLMAVVNDSPHVQKLVAFENIFERLFSIIEEEGGLRGSLVVNDCLSLINNILKYNTSNQTLFLETGNLPKLAHLLSEPISQDEGFFWNDQRIININTALDIVSLTVEPGNTVTSQHQNVLFDSSVLMVVLRLAFFHNIPKRVRPIALLTAANMIRSNEYAQLEFSKIDVPYFDPSLPTNATANDGPVKLVPVIDILINWMLYANSVHTFDTRVACSRLLKAYLMDSFDIQKDFLSHQEQLYNQPSTTNSHGAKENDISENVDEEESANEENISDTKGVSLLKANLFEVLLNYDTELNLNPFKLFFTTDIFMFLFQQEHKLSEELREITRNVTTGNNLDDEEPLKAIQTISELLTTSLTAADIRIPISYLTFLIYWLFGDFKATNDFLSDKSVIKSLLSFSYQIQDEDITIKCLVTMLLGVGYEFSSKESPFPRKEYFEFITKSLGKDNYASRIKQFKKDSFFSEIDQNEDSILTPELDETGLPRVYFSTYFIHLFNENMYRIRTALSHNPDEEPISKISFEEVEELQNQCAKLKSELGSLQAETKTTNEDLTEKLETLSKEHEELIEKYQSLTSSHVSLKENVSGLEIELKSITESLNEMTNSRDALETKDKENYFALQEYKGMIHKQEEAIRILEKELETISSQKKKAEDGINKMGKDLFALSREKQAVEEKQRSLQKEKDKSDSDHQKENKLLKDEITRKITEIKTLNENLVKTKTQYSALSEEKEQTSKELVEYKSRFQSHDNLVTKLTEKLKSLANNYRDLQAKHELLIKSTEETKSESNTQLSNLQDEYDSLSREKENFQTEKDHLTDDIKELKETISRLEHKNEETISKYNSEKDEYESQINQLREQLKSATTTQDDNVNKISELSKDIKNLETTLETCENSKHDLQTKLEASEKTLAEMHENEEHLKEEKNQLEKEVANTKKQLNTLRGNFESLESEHKDSISQVREYEKQITDKEKEYNKNISKLNDEIRAIQQENEALCQNNDNLKNEIEEVKQTLEEQLNLKESRMEALNFQIQDLKVKNQSSEAELSESVKNKEIETEKMIELQKECNSRKEELSELEEKLKTLEVRNSHNLEVLKESEEAENELKEAKKELEIRTNEVKNQSEKIANLDKLNEKTGAELCRLKKTFTDEKRNLEEQLGKLRNEIKIKSQAFEKERKLLNEGSSTITQEYSEKINMLEDQLNKMENESESKTRLIDTSRSDLEKATLSHDEILEEKRNEINKMKDEILSYKEKINEANTKLLSTEQAHENGLNSLKEQLEAIQESKSEVERRLKDMEEESAHLKSDLKKSKETAKDLKSDIENNEKRIELLVKSGKESDEKFKQYKEISQVDIKELQDEKTDLESQIVEFRKKIEELQVKLKDEAESNSKIETIQQELTNAYEKIRVNEEENVLLNSKLKNLECNLRDNQDEIQSTKEKNESLDSYLKDLKQELTDAQQKAKECEEKSKTEIEQLQAEASRSHEIAKQLELKYSNLATEEQTWKRNEEAIKKSTDSQKTEIEKLVEELERLNSENAQLKEANEDRSEIDDLMLLVTDLDEKNTKYRSKLEDLGVELSSEDDDEDEDDEDEEE